MEALRDIEELGEDLDDNSSQFKNVAGEMVTRWDMIEAQPDILISNTQCWYYTHAGERRSYIRSNERMAIEKENILP